MEKIDVGIIGAGIVGLNIAKNLIDKNHNLTIFLFEKEQYLGEHTSGRNSGVLHAGIYYETRSLKHKLCIEGNIKWRELARKLNIPINICGKFIVAKNGQDEELEKIYTKAKSNNVKNIRYASVDEIKNLQNNLNITNAIFSPDTGIIDVSIALKNLKHYLETKNVHVLFKHEVTEIHKDSQNNGFILNTGGENIWCQKLYNCAGLFGVDLRKKLGLFELENYYVKGNYLKTNQKSMFENLIYPIPEKNLKGLGVHLTLDMQNQMKFGPNTEDIQDINYNINEIVFNDMKVSIGNLFKTINLNQLYVDYSGIRPKIKHNREIYIDFWIKSPHPNYIEYLGIESPGLTASILFS